jgi:hypothetical protein
MALQFSPEKKGAVFKALANKPLLDVGFEFGVDKHFSDRMAIRQAVHRIYKEVLVEPGKYGVSDEVVDFVKSSMATRKAITTRKETENELVGLDGIDKGDIKGLVTKGRDKAAVLLHKKMDMISKSKKRLDKESIVNLAKVLGILFDKSQIVQGEATEHIAVLAKVDDKLTPQEQMDMLVKLREKTVADKFN